MALLGALAAIPLPAAAEGFGHLVAIGGGPRPGYMLERIVELAGGDSCRLMIIPMASSEPLETAQYQRSQLEAAGCPRVDFVLFDRQEADEEKTVRQLDETTGVFLSGGDQRRLADKMMDSRLLQRVREILAAGGVVAGTSAGAAIMSEVMITGDEVDNSRDPEFASIRPGYVVTRPGFGFVDRAILDQHFVARGRHNRLISLVLENPSLLGLGIDESTAAVFSSPTRFEVLGESMVVVYDAAAAEKLATDRRGNFSATGIRLHLLGSGQGFDLERREPLTE